MPVHPFLAPKDPSKALPLRPLEEGQRLKSLPEGSQKRLPPSSPALPAGTAT